MVIGPQNTEIEGLLNLIPLQGQVSSSTGAVDFASLIMQLIGSDVEPIGVENPECMNSNESYVGSLTVGSGHETANSVQAKLIIHTADGKKISIPVTIAGALFREYGIQDVNENVNEIPEPAVNLDDLDPHSRDTLFAMFALIGPPEEHTGLQSIPEHNPESNHVITFVNNNRFVQIESEGDNDILIPLPESKSKRESLEPSSSGDSGTETGSVLKANNDPYKPTLENGHTKFPETKPSADSNNLNTTVMMPEPDVDRTSLQNTESPDTFVLPENLKYRVSYNYPDNMVSREPLPLTKDTGAGTSIVQGFDVPGEINPDSPKSFASVTGDTTGFLHGERNSVLTTQKTEPPPSIMVRTNSGDIPVLIGSSNTSQHDNTVVEMLGEFLASGAQVEIVLESEIGSEAGSKNTLNEFVGIEEYVKSGSEWIDVFCELNRTSADLPVKIDDSTFQSYMFDKRIRPITIRNTGKITTIEKDSSPVNVLINESAEGHPQRQDVTASENETSPSEKKSFSQSSSKWSSGGVGAEPKPTDEQRTFTRTPVNPPDTINSGWEPATDIRPGHAESTKEPGKTYSKMSGGIETRIHSTETCGENIKKVPLDTEMKNSESRAYRSAPEIENPEMTSIRSFRNGTSDSSNMTDVLIEAQTDENAVSRGNTVETYESPVEETTIHKNTGRILNIDLTEADGHSYPGNTEAMDSTKHESMTAVEEKNGHSSEHIMINRNTIDGDENSHDGKTPVTSVKDAESTPEKRNTDLNAESTADRILSKKIPGETIHITRQVSSGDSLKRAGSHARNDVDEIYETVKTAEKVPSSSSKMTADNNKSYVSSGMQTERTYSAAADKTWKTTGQVSISSSKLNFNNNKHDGVNTERTVSPVIDSESTDSVRSEFSIHEKISDNRTFRVTGFEESSSQISGRASSDVSGQSYDSDFTGVRPLNVSLHESEHPDVSGMLDKQGHTTGSEGRIKADASSGEILNRHITVKPHPGPEHPETSPADVLSSGAEKYETRYAGFETVEHVPATAFKEVVYHDTDSGLDRISGSVHFEETEPVIHKSGDSHIQSEGESTWNTDSDRAESQTQNFETTRFDNELLFTDLENTAHVKENQPADTEEDFTGFSVSTDNRNESVFETENVPDRFRFTRITHETENRVLNTIVRNARFMITGGQSSAEIKLEPPSLGKIKLEIITENSKITGKITVESHEVKEMIQNSISSLKEQLTGSGLKVESFDVQVGHNSGTDGWAQRERTENLNMNLRRDLYSYESVYGDESPETDRVKHGKSLDSDYLDIWI